MVARFGKVTKSLFLSERDPDKYNDYRTLLRELAEKGFFDQSNRIGWTLANLHKKLFYAYGTQDSNWIFEDDFIWQPLANFMERDGDSLNYRLPYLTFDEIAEVGEDFKKYCQQQKS